MEEVKKVEVVPETPQEKEEAKEPPREIGYKIDGMYLVCTVPLSEPYVALGILYDCLADVRDRLSFARMAEQKRRQELMGGDTLRKGAQQDRSFWKKTFGK